MLEALIEAKRMYEEVQHELKVPSQADYNSNFVTYQNRKRTIRDLIASVFKELERLIRKI